MSDLELDLFPEPTRFDFDPEPRIQLTPDEWKRGTEHGEKYFADAMRQGRTDWRQYQQGNNIEAHRVGARCHFAALKIEGLPLACTDDFKRSGDLPGFREVRGSDQYPDLMIREDDPLERRYCKVQEIRGGTHIFRGWLWGYEVHELGRRQPPTEKFPQAIWVAYYREGVLRPYNAEWLAR